MYDVYFLYLLYVLSISESKEEKETEPLQNESINLTTQNNNSSHIKEYLVINI